jgi:hypothetical protein
MLGPVFDAQSDPVETTENIDPNYFTYYSDTGELIVHQDALLKAGN